VEDLRETGTDLADDHLGTDPHVVEEKRELPLGQHRVHRERLRHQPEGIGGHQKQRHLGLPGDFVGPGAGHDHQRLRLVDTGDVVLGARNQPVVAVPAARGGQLVAVGTGTGLGDRENHLAGAVGHTGEPALLLLVVAEPGDHLSGDRGGHQEQQHRTALGGDLLADDGQLDQAAPAAAIRLGHVDADEPGPGQVVPQLGERLVPAGPFHVVGAAVPRSDLPHGLAQGLQLGLLRELHVAPPM